MKPGPNGPSEGRTSRCPTCRKRSLCSSCGARIRYGKPTPNATWSTLRMEEADWRRLLMAAAEFDAEADVYQDRPTAVEFVDWLFPDVVEKAA